jgi:NhaP-type Na+/H+ or K+/H+ antiporter
MGLSMLLLSATRLYLVRLVVRVVLVLLRRMCWIVVSLPSRRLMMGRPLYEVSQSAFVMEEVFLMVYVNLT